jgi:hypothetical protein
MKSLLALIILGRGLVLLPAFNARHGAVPYTITSHWAATPQDVNNPGDFSGGSHRFTSVNVNNLGLYA